MCIRSYDKFHLILYQLEFQDLDVEMGLDLRPNAHEYNRNTAQAGESSRVNKNRSSVDSKDELYPYELDEEDFGEYRGSY